MGDEGAEEAEEAEEAEVLLLLPYARMALRKGKTCSLEWVWEVWEVWEEGKA